jgi:hypothetical protein
LAMFPTKTSSKFFIICFVLRASPI